MNMREIDRGGRRVGKLLARGANYEVCCAACGRTMGAARQNGREARQRAIESLFGIGWSNEPDGLWRCPKHAPVASQPEKME